MNRERVEDEHHVIEEEIIQRNEEEFEQEEEEYEDEGQLFTSFDLEMVDDANLFDTLA